MTLDETSRVSIAEQAAHWWITINGEEVSAAEQREFAKWVSQTPHHIAAYIRTAAVMKAAKSPDMRWPNMPSEVLIRESKASHGQELRHVRVLPRPRIPIPGKVNWSRIAMATATCVLAAIGVSWLALSGPQEFHTAFGEQRSILLEDGSRIALNTESAVRVELREDRRLVSLEAGEALFQVSHDAKRPFDVSVGSVVVRAVGTEFNIERTGDRTTISVVEGRVAVMPAAQNRSGAGNADPTVPGIVFLTAADRLIVDRSGWGTPVHGVDLKAVLAWTDKRLVFAHTPLSQAAQQFNRYNKTQIQIRGSQLQAREISGVFKSDDPASFLAFLSKVPGVTVQDGADGTHIVEQHP